MTEFTPNTLVLAFHGPLMYQAKVLKVHHANQDFVISAELKEEPLDLNPRFDKRVFLPLDAYLLHYQGWNSKWDEWVTRDRVLEFNDENRQIQKDLENMRKKRKQKRTEELEANSNANNKKRADPAPLPVPVKKRAPPKKPIVSIEFPNQLKYLLIDDWEFITKDRQLVKLPSPKPVSLILSDYKKSQELTAEQKDILEEVISGLELYFNQSLDLLLLYKAENLQHMNLLKLGKNASDTYGLEHLLRLLISLPGLIGQTSMDNVSVSVLVAQVTELLTFVKENVLTYVNEYENMSPQYDNLSKI